MPRTAGGGLKKLGLLVVLIGGISVLKLIPHANSSSSVNSGGFPYGQQLTKQQQPTTSDEERVMKQHDGSSDDVMSTAPATTAVQPKQPLNLQPAGKPPSGQQPGFDSDRVAEREKPYQNPYPPMKLSSKPCRNGAHLQGRWVKNESLKPRYPSMGEILGCCQRGADAEHGPGYVRPELQYEWIPDECEFIPWSEEDFCKSLRGRDIMIAGDSLNDHWHASLYYLLGGRKDIYKHEGTIRGKHRCHGHAICAKYYPKPIKLFFLTNQLLTDSSRPGRNYKWWKTINEYPILILNSGSWMRDPANEEREVSDEEWQKHQQTALRLVRSKGYNGTLIWRTAYQGHPYCWNYKEPLTEELRPEDFPTVAPYKRYRWAAIPGRNDFAVKLWTDAGAHILDIKRITNLMPLGHLGQNHPKFKLKNITDCLHYCSPGPTYDTWSMLLMNLLLGNLS